MNENDIRAIALFFYFALLDDRKAIEAGAEALNLARDRKKREGHLKNSVCLVDATFRIWEKWAAQGVAQRLMSLHSAWQLPEGFDLGPWREFHKNATSEELVTLIWSQILGLSEEDIAAGLSLPEGTVRYRLGRALNKLGGTSAFRPKLI